MKREEAIIKLKDLLYNFKEFTSIETMEEDVQALEYAIKELERTVQEQYVTLKIDSTEIARVVIDEINRQQKRSHRILIV
ncbi:hypothetical protein [Clostridium septicum]|uniref:Uncharacterized protein n=1 Tax=Clostridium septicum TaxID=1504 RepID=A0A9N7JNW2_CLOSE|nr:hypothetical protein [Clostridium septicum]AYE35674.1 hypothetical protein CP523_15230 [Clostridium septicum]UEC19655.1 hypothetical protein LK444_09485 [Clostridium septicum]USS02284.1 hypothetical protein NH397_07690 [Clostridium septicum]WLF70867.1 hypothetical protein Q6375_07795 [Clostridium septicum]